jgi:hypothetical protein
MATDLLSIAAVACGLMMNIDGCDEGGVKAAAAAGGEEERMNNVLLAVV